MVEVGMMLNDRYEILEKIGEGGSAVVFKAKCHILNRFVAVKVLKDDLSADAEFVEKFKREAYAVASLSDNNIVNIYDIETEGDASYIIQEYIDGKTLKEVITESKKLNYKDAVDKCRQIASALDCAHKNKIIHRDIKPHNVLVTKEGVLKVADFGIAKAADSATIIKTEKVMGSAQYLSPEQAKGNHVDARTDIYSLGIVLYEMLTGKVPFDGENAVSIALKQIQEKPVPPIELNPEVPIALNDIVLKAMEKEPIKRYQSAKELIESLDNFSSNIEFTNSTMNNEFTRVMDPIGDTTFFNPSDIEELKKNEEFTGDNEKKDDENEIDDAAEPKTKKSPISKRTKTIIAAFLVVIALGAIAAIGYTIGMGPSASKTVVQSITVPNVVGMQQADAKKLVESKKLKFTVAETKSSDKPKGEVTDCNPKVGGKINTGDEVRVIISSGPGQVTVPTVAGTDEKSAEAAIVAAGFTVGNHTKDYSDTIKYGNVISTDPTEGSSVTKGTTINLVVSMGAKIKTSKVPDVSNKSKNDAISAITAVAGLSYNTVTIQTTDKSLDNIVAKQDPIAGSVVKQGSVVTITVNQYVDNTVDVPSVVGQSQAAAKSALESAGFVISVNPTNATATTQAQSNTVQAQDKSGKQTKGSTITVTMYGQYAAPVTPTPDNATKGNATPPK